MQSIFLFRYIKRTKIHKSKNLQLQKILLTSWYHNWLRDSEYGFVVKEKSASIAVNAFIIYFICNRCHFQHCTNKKANNQKITGFSLSGWQDDSRDPQLRNGAKKKPAPVGANVFFYLLPS